MLHVAVQFMPVLLSGFLVNLEIGLAATVIAVVFGVPLAMLRRGFAITRPSVGLAVRLMQALPTYVVMFIVLNMLPRDLMLYGRPIAGLTAVVFAQSIYLIAYVAEDATEALGHLDRNDRERALLFLPNLLRGFTVVVMSSGFGAAVGVSEAVNATMHQAERLPAIGDRITLFAVAIGFFAIIVGGLNIVIRHFVAKLVPRVVHNVG